MLQFLYQVYPSLSFNDFLSVLFIFCYRFFFLYLGRNEPVRTILVSDDTFAIFLISDRTIPVSGVEYTTNIRLKKYLCQSPPSTKLKILVVSVNPTNSSYLYCLNLLSELT